MASGTIKETFIDNADEFEDLIDSKGKDIVNVYFEGLGSLENNYPFEDLNFEHCSFVDIDLTRNEFKNVSFKKCKFAFSNFTEIDFKNVSFKKCKFAFSNFTEIDFRKTYFEKCDFELTTFDEVRLAMPAFLENDMERTVFRNMRFEYEVESTLAIMKVGLDLTGLFRTEGCAYCKRKTVKEDLCINCWKFQRNRHQNLAEHKKTFRKSKGKSYENYYPSGMNYP